MAVDPTPEDLERFLAEDPDGPVVMLNLLRFKDGGRSSYEEYGRRVVPFLERVGATVVYAGECSEALIAAGPEEWDVILLVRYPSRRAFGEMVANPEYLGIAHLRSEALSAAVLQPTTPWDDQPA